MNKLQRFNKKILMSTVALVLAATAFIASVCYAWFVIGLNSKTNNTYTQVVGDNIAFGSTFSAVKHYTTTDETTEVGTDGLAIANYNYYISAGEILAADSASSGNPFFDTLSPGDYVDITFSVYATAEDALPREYKIFLSEFATDSCDTGTKNSERSYSFELKDADDNFMGTVYGALGVFQWGIIKTTVYSNGVATETTESETLQYFHNGYSNTFDYYDNGSKDDEYKQTIQEGIVFNSVGIANRVEITLRIKVDLTDFYKLLDKKKAKTYDVDNSEYYLNNIILSIGKIVLSATDSKSDSTSDEDNSTEDDDSETENKNDSAED